MSIVLIRHTRPDVADNTCYGITDLTLADSFDAEAGDVIAGLDGGDVLVTSPLQRCTQLAEKIGDAFNLRPNIDQRVREMDFGTWEGLAWSELPRNELDQWAQNFLHARPHGGDSVAMLRERTLAALAEYHERRQRFIIVTHSGVFKAALSDGDTAEHFRTVIDFGGIVNYLELQDQIDG